jgi:hypothetical protein
MALPGSYKNPSERPCWSYCSSCSRCADKGRYTACNGCSGRFDPKGMVDVNNDDYCDCKNGNLRWTPKNGGKSFIVKFKSNPFKAKVTYEKKSEDERDWDSYVSDMREKMNDPTWNPITIVDED